MGIVDLKTAIPGPKGQALLDRWHQAEYDSVGYQAPVVWDEGHGIWTFTRVTDNTYKARYEGDFAGEGIAVTQGNRLLIDFAADNLKVHHDLVVSKDGKRAEGTWTSSDGESETTVLVYKGGSGTPIISLDAAPPATLPPGFKTGAPPPAFASATQTVCAGTLQTGSSACRWGNDTYRCCPKWRVRAGGLTRA